jgi:meiotically up-regulated gene 157 (Mug157) protein
LLIDPYANAFNPTPSGECWHKDFVDQSPWVFERKFEIDSLAAFFELAISLHRTGRYSQHLDEDFWQATVCVLDVIESELAHDPGSYKFVRPGAAEHDHLSHGGIGAPFKNCGLVWSGFRPSDDRCVYPFNIPGNAHLSVTLQAIAEIAAQGQLSRIAERATRFASIIDEGLQTLSREHEMWPYEIDGLGNALFEDDPNFPSLLSLPFLGYCDKDDEMYLRTRAYLLSPQHRLWRRGVLGDGLASDHTPQPNIWPLAIAMRGMTSTSQDELEACLRQMDEGDAGTGSMHESFDPDDPAHFTRPWFSWADMAYCDLALDFAGVPRVTA